MSSPKKSACALLVALLAPAAAAQESVQVLPEIVVTATRSPQAAFDVPASINAVSISADDARIKSSDYLLQVPGTLARDRQNYAQDEQISIRGFGARATFGVRGVRLYTDGIPATMPDGQGQTAHFNIASAERIEVLRGPFSALYGNSSGGVVQLFTAEGATPAQWNVTAGGGSDGARLARISGRGVERIGSYSVEASYFGTDGYREHSAAERFLTHARLGFQLGNGGTLTLLANGFDMPLADDPQGLTAAQVQADPRQAAPSAKQFNTRKTVRQDQGGAIYEQAIGNSQLRLLAYGGQRAVLQYLSVPVAAQASPLSSGGVVDLDSSYGGADARWSWRGALVGRPLEVTGGLSYDRQNQQRRGYENFVGSELGVRGNLRRDERNQVYNFDQYLQGEWQLATRWFASAGVRQSEVRFKSEDRYINDTNPDDSGRRGYAASNPVAGLSFCPDDRWRLYASYGRGFETPTFNELAYRPGGETGLNFDLPAARSNNFELGARHRYDGGGALELAVFDARTRDELVVFSNMGGRSTFQSAGRAQRRGLELGWRHPLASQWTAALSYTWLQAQFRSDFSNCATPETCTIPSGTAIPGVPRSHAYGEIRWTQPSTGWRLGLTLQALDQVPVDDAGTQHAPGYALWGLDAAYSRSGSGLSGFVRMQNLLDQRYIGSVIVNESNGRYFEPGPGLGFFAGLQYSL